MREVRVGQDPELFVVIRSAGGEPDPEGWTWFTVEVVAKGLRASTGVSACDDVGQALPSFFRELASNWKGWEGTRMWSSIESDLSIAAEFDPRGRVCLVVSLRDDAVWTWECSVQVEVDAGEELMSV